MSKKIISIGFDIPGQYDKYNSYSSDQSLLDADIIFFQPSFSSYRTDHLNSEFEGKILYNESSSFQLKEDTSHWLKELSIALTAGKTVFVFFKKYKEVRIHTGRKDFSGTGRNARQTNIVENFTNYNFLPVSVPKIISKEGKEIKFNNNILLSTFWLEFKEYLKYESYFDGKIDKPLFFTKTGEKPIGGIFSLGSGNLIILPVIDFNRDGFTKISKTGDETWTPKAINLGNRLIQVLIDIDKVIRNSTENTPPPPWVLQNQYELQEESILKQKITKISEEVDKLIHEKNKSLKLLNDETLIKQLLYEKGIVLENIVIVALKILGYSAENYNDGELELDQVIISPEGDRFIGETEGKDNSAINIDKFRQLTGNIQEDLQRDDVQSAATGILFGNGYRLTEPDTRQEEFTEKCIKSAQQQNIILIRTKDLFPIVKYLKGAIDNLFAKKCRDAIKNSKGKIVEFPEIPRITAKELESEKASVKSD